MNNRHLDDAIDRAVREMMDVDAPPEFRARVAARIERPASGFPGWLRLAVAGGAAAAVIVAFTLARRPDPASIPAKTATSGAASATVPSAAPSSESSVARGASVAVSTPPARRDTRPRRIDRNVTQQIATGAIVAAAVEDAMPEAAVTALERIDGIAIAPLAQEPVGPAPLVIAPLTPVTELEIAPLPPQAGRN